MVGGGTAGAFPYGSGYATSKAGLVRVQMTEHRLQRRGPPLAVRAEAIATADHRVLQITGLQMTAGEPAASVLK